MNLKKNLGLVDVFCVASGAMISSGLFILPGLAHAEAGPAVVVSYFLAGVLAMTGMLSQAELVSAMPKAGGDYYYVMRSMGPAVGTVAGLVTWFSLSLKSAFALIGMAAFTHGFGAVDIRWMASVLCVVFVAINLVGVKSAANLQRILVFGLLGLLLYFVVRGLPHVEVRRFEPFAPHGMGAVFATAGFVFVSFGGLLKVAAVAEEVDRPSRTIPLGMILSLVLVSTLYTVVVFVASGVLDASVLGRSLTPISDAAGVFLGPTGRLMLSLAAVLAFVSTANAGIMSASRYPLALSRDDLLPAWFGRVNPRFQTPHTAIILTGAFMILMLFLRLTLLVKVASSVLILTFLFSCLSVIIMRESRVQNYQPKFRSPLYPWIQLIGIAGCVFLLFEMGPAALGAAAGLIGGGLFIYWFYGRIRTSREFALLHLVERITSRALTDNLLETELKEVIRERDQISQDRFDTIIEDALVLDLEQSIPVEEFFGIAARELSGRVDVPPPRLLHLLREREQESSTVIAPGLAIPHLVLEGEHHFDILLARCRQGIVFSADVTDVQAVFVLAGTRDERNFHLKALSAIAQVAQDPSFRARWVKARDAQGLRDIVLLGKRIRHS